MLVNWILSRIEETENGEEEVNFLYDNFIFCLTEYGYNDQKPSLRLFIEVLKSVLPNIERARRKVGHNYQTVYRGLRLKPINHQETILFTDVPRILPSNYHVRKTTETEINIEYPSGYTCSGNEVYKTIKINSDNKWELVVAEKCVDLQSLYIDNSYTLSECGIKLILLISDKLDLCNGLPFRNSITLSRSQTLDMWQRKGETPVRTVRSLTCLKVLPINSKTLTCRTCQKMTFKVDKENIPPECNSPTIPASDSLLENIKKIFPQASEPMIELLLEQAKNVSRHPKGRRWSQKFIQVCLQMYNRSPHCYQTLSESNMLILPSKSLLILYKNSVKQNPGFEEEIFDWMLSEANRIDIPEGERYGGIIFDEMAIQTDIEIDKTGNVVELSGFTDYGNEGDMCHALRQGTKEKSLGKYVLQLLFLGTSGFRFPFAHFITNTIQASELFGLFWKTVYMLRSYGFFVLYVCMDGAQANRSFMHMCLGEKPTSFIAKNPCTTSDIIFLMDFSHVMKKIRNNILKSGLHEKCSRMLTLQSSNTIQWQMFVDCFRWDQQNALQMHKKLTNEHFCLDSQLKMRNHLAEDILNKEMLHLMKLYQNSLGKKGQVLDGAIELLENTSSLVDIFRDMRPIKTQDDIRLTVLQNVSDWFLNWQNFVNNNPDISQREKNKALLSQQCLEDIQSCIQGFIALCKTVLKNSSIMYITPGLINSDVIENIFNQQRSTYHGANSNPNSLQYGRALNSVIVGQNVISSKSNAGKTYAEKTHLPNHLPSKNSLRKKSNLKNVQTDVEEFKVIRL